MAKVLVTGSAGFIGFHLADKLLARGDQVVGLDNLNDYYDPSLKRARLDILMKHQGFTFAQVDLSHREPLHDLLGREKFDFAVNLAAQAGVRYSIINPDAYIQSNLVGFGNLLEGCRINQMKHLVFASSSSVYGANTQMPFSVHQNVDHPLSLYAATKKSNELMAHSYAHLFRLPVTGLRFFTVYGPWGRPDMALFLFTRAIMEDRPIDIFNRGEMQRDFTYIDDVVTGVIRVMDRIPQPDPQWSSQNPDPSSSNAPYRLYNIGNNQPVPLMRYIEALESFLGRKAKKNLLPMQPGDVPATWANIDSLVNDVDFHPKTTIESGIERFVQWYRSYYGV